jgi:hypothetical protein
MIVDHEVDRYGPSMSLQETGVHSSVNINLSVPTNLIQNIFIGTYIHGLGWELTNIGGGVDFDQPHIFVSAVTSLTNIIDEYMVAGLAGYGPPILVG